MISDRIRRRRFVPKLTRGFYRNGTTGDISRAPLSLLAYTGNATATPLGNDGFTRKGVNQLEVYGAASAGAPTADMKNNWIKREYIMCASKVLG